MTEKAVKKQVVVVKTKSELMSSLEKTIKDAISSTNARLNKEQKLRVDEVNQLLDNIKA